MEERDSRGKQEGLILQGNSFPVYLAFWRVYKSNRAPLRFGHLRRAISRQSIPEAIHISVVSGESALSPLWNYLKRSRGRLLIPRRCVKVRPTALFPRILPAIRFSRTCRTAVQNERIRAGRWPRRGFRRQDNLWDPSLHVVHAREFEVPRL